MTPEKSVPDLGDEMIRPPFKGTMRVLDRSVFHRKIPTVAAVIQDPRNISKFKSDLRRDTLPIDRLQTIQPVKDANGQATGKKGLILKLNVKMDDSSTWSPNLRELVGTSQVHLTPLDVDLDYDYWRYVDIISSCIPAELQDDIPHGYNTVGHIAHFNLRKEYLPYKSLIATVLLDKHPHIRTVINKIEDVGASNRYRTFNYELLAGADDLQVETTELNCTYRFDYSKVYWNSRLNSEHERLVQAFAPGEAVADVMAGVGPFAAPAGKKGCFVYANDLNPDSYASLRYAIHKNKVGQYVRPCNDDGFSFIQSATDDLFTTTHKAETTPVVDFSRRIRRHPSFTEGPPERTFVDQPKTFAHYVLNLPASATAFLPAFIGLHASRTAFFAANPDIKLPMIHVYCFSTKSEDNVKEGKEICKEISRRLGHEMKPATSDHHGDEGGKEEGRKKGELNEDEVQIYDVRDVAPDKRMFCASFRLPAAVAFADK